ncbi:sugar 3,4-ketoisomerase [Haloimpatiens sp. FM7330]|uniref:sugar 3,4-ketoisomerase n=1 Tax=Haloimpatiens sp. FM7330 TaxID=3298610 RepID=UPI00363AD54A
MNSKKIQFKKIKDKRGALIPIEESRDIPFDIRRIYYIFNVGKGVRRGYHTHKTLQQVLICINGSCKILLDDGKEKEIVFLNERNSGLFIGPNTWREMYDFTEDAVLLVLASNYYDEKDYIRDYCEFLKYVGSERVNERK